MGAFLNLMAKEAMNRRRGERSQNLLGNSVTTTGSMQSADEFDEFGNPIFGQAVAQDPRREGTGFLGSDRGPAAQYSLQKNLLDAGFDNSEAKGLLGTVMPVGSASEVNSTGLLNNPNDPATIMKYRNDALASGMKSEAVNQQIKAAQRVGSFENQNQQLGAYRGQKNDFERQIAPSRSSLETFQQATDVINDRGGFGVDQMTPADDLALITSFAKLQRPGEALMEGDVTNIVKTSSIWDQVKSFMNEGGASALSPETRKKIYNTMKSMANTQEKRYKGIREQASKTFKESGFAGLSSPLRKQLDVTPYKPRPMTREEFAAAKARGEI